MEAREDYIPSTDAETGEQPQDDSQSYHSQVVSPHDTHLRPYDTHFLMPTQAAGVDVGSQNYPSGTYQAQQQYPHQYTTLTTPVTHNYMSNTPQAYAPVPPMPFPPVSHLLSISDIPPQSQAGWSVHGRDSHPTPQQVSSHSSHPTLSQSGRQQPSQGAGQYQLDQPTSLWETSSTPRAIEPSTSLLSTGDQSLAIQYGMIVPTTSHSQELSSSFAPQSRSLYLHAGQRRPEQLAIYAEIRKQHPKVEFRMLHKEQVIYRLWSGQIRDAAQAIAHLNRRKWQPNGWQSDDSIPRNQASKLLYAQKLFYAMTNFTSSFVDKVQTKNKVNRLVQQAYDQREIEARCILAVDMTVRLHTKGSWLLASSDPTYETILKAKDPESRGKGADNYRLRNKSEHDRNMTFAQRWQALCEACTACKAVATDILDGDKMEDAIYGATSHTYIKVSNMVNNDNKHFESKRKRQEEEKKEEEAKQKAEAEAKAADIASPSNAPKRRRA